MRRFTTSLCHLWQCARCGLWSDTEQCQHC